MNLFADEVVAKSALREFYQPQWVQLDHTHLDYEKFSIEVLYLMAMQMSISAGLPNSFVDNVASRNMKNWQSLTKVNRNCPKITCSVVPLA